MAVRLSLLCFVVVWLQARELTQGRSHHVSMVGPGRLMLPPSQVQATDTFSHASLFNYFEADSVYDLSP